MTTILPLSEKAHAQALISAFDDAIRALREYEAPRVSTTTIHPDDDPDEVETVAVCPWCQERLDNAEGIIEIDTDRRENTGELDLDGPGYVSISQGDSEHETFYYTVSCCSLPVTLPEAWTVAWD